MQRLSDVVRPTAVASQTVDLNEQIVTMVELSRPRWKDEPESRGVAIEVVTELGQIPQICVSLGELSEVILNLILNTVDASPLGGTIRITTHLIDNGFVSMTVSHTGKGMDEETSRRIFAPFFTTKMDVGSGLGLSTAHGSVMRSGGTMEVESEVGQGTSPSACPYSKVRRQKRLMSRAKVSMRGQQGSCWSRTMR